MKENSESHMGFMCKHKEYKIGYDYLNFNEPLRSWVGITPLKLLFSIFL
jgi:hypothetical protein